MLGCDVIEFAAECFLFTFRSEMSTFLLITGMPGCGKTTMIKRLVADLQQTASAVKLQGFYTEEARNAQNERIGFDVVTLDGKRGPLAKIR